MKFLLIVLSFLIGTAHATCDPMSVAGNTTWANPSDADLLTTSDSTILIGVDCDDKILVRGSTATHSVQDDYAYFLPAIEFDNGRYDFEFAVDFAEILPVIGTGNKIDFLELMVEPEFNPNNTLHKIAKVRIKKKPLAAGGHGWKVHFIWFDLPDNNGNVVVDIQDSFWLPEDISHGLLHFHISWAKRSSLGGVTYINITADLRDSVGSPIQINTADTIDSTPTSEELSFSKTFQSPYFQPGYKLAETRLGIIRHDHGVNVGDGLTFHRPLVFD